WLGDRGDQIYAAASTRLPAAVCRAGAQGSGHKDDGGGPDPHGRAGRGGTRRGTRGPPCHRARGALRPELAAARGAGARRRSADGALAGTVRLVAHAAREPAAQAGATPLTTSVSCRRRAVRATCARAASGRAHPLRAAPPSSR